MDLRRLTAGTAALTGVLLLLGVYTAAVGAGLTCEARWPLCDGAVFGLFPATWGSFVEWFHRLVAMVTGFAILGTAVAAWRRGAGRRVRGALTGATLLLPAQIGLGALTVTQYQWLVLRAHFVAGLAIFTGVALAALWTAGTADRGVARRGALAAAALLVPFSLLTPRVFVVFDSTVQVAYYALGLAGYAALLAVAVWAGGRPRALAGAGAAALFAILVVGRQTTGDAVQVAVLAGTAGAVVLAAAAARRLGREGYDAPTGDPLGSSD